MPNYHYLTIEGIDMLLPRLILHFFPLCPVLTAVLVEYLTRNCSQKDF